MKYLAIILSFLTITLSAIPCDDEVNNDMVSISIVTVEQHSSDQHSVLDLCSPFCTCVCCASVVVEPVFDQELAATEYMNTEVNTSYIFSFSRDFSKSVFQPPQA